MRGRASVVPVYLMHWELRGCRGMDLVELAFGLLILKTKQQVLR